MHGEDLLIDDGSNGQAVEAVGKCLPELDIVSTFAFVVESIDAVDGCAFMVSSEDEEIFGVLDLVGQKQTDGLQGLFSSIDVVTEEEVVGLGREAAVLKQPEQIVVLPMNVAANLSNGRQFSAGHDCVGWTRVSLP